MRTTEWTKAGLILALIGAASLTQAEQGNGQGKGKGGQGGRRMPPEMLEKYDTDGDGKLSEEERTAMREEMKERMKQFDTDGDGKLNEEEREAMREAMGGEGGKERGGPEGKRGKGGPRMSPEERAAMLEKFDTDGDGKLSEEEWAAARKAMEQKRGERPEGEEGKGKDKKKGKSNREEMIKKYDADGDGKLSEEERDAMRKDRKKKK